MLNCHGLHCKDKTDLNNLDDCGILNTIWWLEIKDIWSLITRYLYQVYTLPAIHQNYQFGQNYSFYSTPVLIRVINGIYNAQNY